jgi:hypothetical protein
VTTKRDYAASLGLAVAGARGRLSREAHDAIAKAEANGMVFDDVKPVVTAPRIKPAKPVTVKQTDSGVGVAGDVLQLHDADALFVGTDSHGKRWTVNARQVCKHSGYSMTSCPCGRDHEVLVPSMEHIIVKRK